MKRDRTGGSNLPELKRRRRQDRGGLLIIAGEQRAKEVAEEIRESSVRFHPLAYYDLDGNYGLFGRNGRLTKITVNCEGPVDGMTKLVTKIGANDVFIARPISYDTLVGAMLKLGKDKGKDKVKFMASPDAYEACTGWVGRRNGWVLPAVDLSTGNLPPLHRVVKRYMDIGISLATLLVFAPFLALIAVLIKLTSEGPVFYRQMRCGRHGRPFKIYKFRTMVKNAEGLLKEMIDFDSLKEPVFKFKDDPRVTGLGKIFRKTSVDEIPQLFNVLKGDLSLVGPRPEELALVERYNPYFKERLKIKPGITGLQQVTCRSTTSMSERMRYDLAYIRNRSLWLDVKILFKTVWVVLLQKRAG